MSETPIEAGAEAVLMEHERFSTMEHREEFPTAAARAVFESIDEVDLGWVLREHNIECTGPGEVTCRCREGGWMSFGSFALHQAEAVKNYLLSERTGWL